MGQKPPLNIVYLSYDGMTDPLGRSQVLAYLQELSSQFRFTIISFEKVDNFELRKAEIYTLCAEHRITWMPMAYHQFPPVFSTLFDLVRGWSALKKAMRLLDVDIVHCRGYITALLGLRAKRKYKVRFIFDMRGFWADEKVESGAWCSQWYQPVYRYFKKCEKRFFQEADCTVSLTEVGKRYIVEEGWAPPDKIGVIPTCVDKHLFPDFDMSIRDSIRTELGIAKNERVIIYSGSIGGNYEVRTLLQIITAAHLKAKVSHSLIVTQSDPRLLFDDPAWHHYGYQEQLQLLSAPITEVHRYLQAADFGIIFYKEGFSNLGRSPTKLAEYLVSGVMPVSPGFVGDLRDYFENIYGNDKSMEDLLKLFRDSQTLEREVIKWAQTFFGIKRGAAIYKNLYEQLSSRLLQNAS